MMRRKRSSLATRSPTRSACSIATAACSAHVCPFAYCARRDPTVSTRSLAASAATRQAPARALEGALLADTGAYERAEAALTKSYFEAARAEASSGRHTSSASARSRAAVATLRASW